jgi:hypothetical protein
MRDLHKELGHATPKTKGILIRWAAINDTLISPISWLLGGGRDSYEAAFELAGLAPGEAGKAPSRRRRRHSATRAMELG